MTSTIPYSNRSMAATPQSTPVTNFHTLLVEGKIPTYWRTQSNSIPNIEKHPLAAKGYCDSKEILHKNSPLVVLYTLYKPEANSLFQRTTLTQLMLIISNSSGKHKIHFRQKKKETY